MRQTLNSYTTTRMLWMCVMVLGTFFLVWTRMAGLDWGLPYPMHPDERNMAVAIIQMHCAWNSFPTCLNPHFFAYGQPPLYIGLLLGHILHFIFSKGIWSDINLSDATLALRILSAASSIATVFILLRTLKLFIPRVQNRSMLLAGGIATSVPAAIQFAHFGTTESLMMCAVAYIMHESLYFLSTSCLDSGRFTMRTGVALGIAIAIKVSAVQFALIPVIAVLIGCVPSPNGKSSVRSSLLFNLVRIGSLAVCVFLILSPFSIFAWQEFLGSMNYETSVGTGSYRAFYTRQFEFTTPILFPFWRIFPYALGGPLCVPAAVAFIFLPWNKKNILLRMSIVSLFVPSSLLYAKWTRFFAALYPLITLLVMVYIVELASAVRHVIISRILYMTVAVITLVSMVPGIAYISIYTNEDVRAHASDWISSHIPEYAHVLSETANVVDIPFETPHAPPEMLHYTVESFGMYDVDTEPQLADGLRAFETEVPVIFVPSRRVFFNHTCFRPAQNGYIEKKMIEGYDRGYCAYLRNMYPQLYRYYSDLFSGASGFRQTAQFTSYPRIEFGGKTLLEFPDEEAEETWTVFDHPVVRIWERE